MSTPKTLEDILSPQIMNETVCMECRVDFKKANEEIRSLVQSAIPEKKQIAPKYPSGFDKGFNTAIDQIETALKDKGLL